MPGTHELNDKQAYPKFEPLPNRLRRFHFWRWFWLTFLVVSLVYAWYCFYVPIKLAARRSRSSPTLKEMLCDGEQVESANLNSLSCLPSRMTEFPDVRTCPIQRPWQSSRDRVDLDDTDAGLNKKARFQRSGTELRIFMNRRVTGRSIN